MRFLTCEPNISKDPKYIDEAEVFFKQPHKWLKEEYTEKDQKPANPSSDVLIPLSWP